MPKIRRFIDIAIPVTTCNLRCHYCYVTQRRLFSARVDALPYPIGQIRRALSKERLGGTCLLNLCGAGETMLPEYIVPLTQALIDEGHYVMIVTNGTVSARISEMLQALTPQQRERLFFKISFHYLELKRLNLIDAFFNNVNRIRESGCSFTVEITPSDELIPHIADVMRLSIGWLGALPHVTVARDERKAGLPILTKLSREDYEKVWSQFHSPLFDYKISVFNQPPREFCYNGMWGGVLNLGNGIFKACYHAAGTQNILAHPEKPVKFRAIGRCCSPHCYNAHAWITFGMIPELDAPTYASMRDRNENTERAWLQPQMRDVFNCKLAEANSLLSDKEIVRIKFMRTVERSCRTLRHTVARIITAHQ